MARARTSHDVFNAIGDPGRRRMLDLLMRREMTVTGVSREVGLSQPQTSKHLRVLREVGAVRVRQDGRRRYYRAEADALVPVHAWSASLLEVWEARFERLESVASEDAAGSGR